MTKYQVCKQDMTKNIIGVIIEIESMMTMMTTITIMEGIEDEEVSSVTCLIFDYRKYRRKSLLTATVKIPADQIDEGVH